MPGYFKKGISVWIFGFFTILAILNAFNSVLLWTTFGSNYEFEPYLIRQYIGNLQVMQYFWISIFTAFIFLGGTAIMASRNPDRDEAILAINSHLVGHRNSLENIESNLIQKWETQKRVNEKYFETFGVKLESYMIEILDNLHKPEEQIQKEIQEQFLTIGSNLGDFRKELSGAFSKQKEILGGVGRLSKTIEKAKGDLADMKKGLQSVETSLVPRESQITVENSLEDLKGIGPRTKEELATLGITNIGGFLATDPTVIADKTRLSLEKVSDLHGTIQLLMIPDIDEKDVELLEKVGVKNRADLAARNPFELNIAISEVAKTYINDKKLLETEKPILEDVLYWVQMAKL